MQTLKKAWDWVVKSSVNANQLSLTVKAFLYGIIPGILFLANLAHVQIGSAELTSIVDGIVQVIVTLGGFISALVFVVGLVRKIVFTITGDNEVVAGWHN